MVTHTAERAQHLPRDMARYLRFREQFAIEPPALPGRDDVEHAATVLRRSAGWFDGQDVVVPSTAGRVGIGHAEGRTFRLEVSVGAVTVRAFDAARAERADERSTRARAARVDMAVLYADDDGVIREPEGPPSREVWEWSAKSRARMFQTIAQLDVADWFMNGPEGSTLGMVTVTLPDRWQWVAPTGRAFKALQRSLVQAFRRAGVDHRMLWKLEFQDRGAPHVHMLMRVPVMVAGAAFDDWLRATWTMICLRAVRSSCDLTAEQKHDYETVDYPKAVRSGLTGKKGGATSVDFDQRKMSDPRRIATYFLGHSVSHAGGKEYQHIVPAEWTTPGAGPGRFWGYTGLDKVAVPVDVDQDDYYAVRRVLRHVARARAWKQQQDAARYGKSVKRWGLRSLGARGGITGGTVIVNDGVSLGLDVARVLDLRRTGACRPRIDWTAPEPTGSHAARLRCDCGSAGQCPPRWT